MQNVMMGQLTAALLVKRGTTALNNWNKNIYRPVTIHFSVNQLIKTLVENVLPTIF